MKQRICLLLVLIFALSTASIAETNGTTSEFGLKGFAWGDSMEKVKEVEGTNIASSGKKDDSDVSYIVYETMVAGHKMHLKYSFNNEGMCEVRYISAEQHSDNSLYLDDYAAFKDILKKQYGYTIFQFENWKDESKKSSYANRKGDAVSRGYLTYSMTWFEDDSFVFLEMSAENGQISVFVTYFH